jgi:hypothetical protein
MTTIEKQLIDLCRDLVKAITKENYDLVIRFHNLEQEMDAAVPAPQPPKKKQEKPQEKKELLPEIAQGAMPWDKEDMNAPQKPMPVPEDYEKPVKIVPPEDDLPF